MATIEEFEKQTWDVINCYFENNKGYQLVKHQLESFNDFILRKLDQIIEGFNTIEIQHQFIPEVAKFKYMLTIDIKNPVISKPIIYEKDGSTKTMTPNDARQRNFTYSSNVNVDMIITAKTLGDNNEYTMDTKQINGVLLGKIPIMVKSNYCILNNKMALVYGNECKYDYGGYFLINGNEKVIISQDRISENKTYVFINNKISTYSHIAEIRSVQENKLGVPKITSLKLSAKGNQFGRFIRANIHHIKTDVPIFILFKALGLNNDKEIIKYIVYDLDDQLNSILINELIGSIEEANNIQCPKDALEYLSKYLNITGYPKEILNNKIHRINIIRNVLATEFLPHVGREFHKKALYLGYMVNKLLKCFLGLKEFDDRDSYINKKVDTPGVLMANLFRQYYGKVIKDMKNMIQKEINIGGWKATNKFINVINKVNIYKIVKSTIIDSGMRYALATGNWGIKNNKNKQGVAQVLNRMTYSATISHMRRINTPIEKSGKLVQPRKLHSTQWGIICPSETPEGASVGLVKNMSMICSITISSNSVNVREIIREHGAIMFDGSNIDMFHKNTKIIVNGDIIGIHLEPYGFYNKLKADKLMGTINIYTSIIWNIKENEIAISTEGGRCVRPLYIVENGNRTKLTDEIIENIRHSKMEWKDLLINHGAIEFLDVEEANHSMTAMKYADILKGQKGALMPVKYTHLEIHPSLILGVLASTIPFSDHNQSPRNCFPVEDHEVLTAHGFIGLDKILEYTADGKELAVACHVNGCLEYHNIGRDRVVYQDDNGEILTATDFVAFESKTSPYERKIPGKTAVSLLATANHNMYGRLGFATKIGENSYRWSQKDTSEYKTHEAGEVVKFAGEDQESSSPNRVPVFQLQCNFNKGIVINNEESPFVLLCTALGLVTNEQINAFLWFYGYWIGDGWLDEDGYITVEPLNKQDIDNLIVVTEKLPHSLKKREIEGKITFSIYTPSWCEYFAKYYVIGEAGGTEKLFCPWVFDSLDASKLKIILSGLTYADGNEISANIIGGVINTKSACFKDEAERVCILAGYSVITNYEKSGEMWNITYTTASVSTAPYLEIGSEIKEVKMTDAIPIFCVAVPTESHLIMVRRKARGDQMASRATIVGNTYQCCKTDTPVLMADNTYKLIKDIKVGEEVITFDPITKYTNVTKVINQYVKPTDLPIMEILTVSGRKITTTDNHHFMTNQGWKEVKHFDDDTCLSISMEQIPLSTECEEFDVLNLEILSKVLSSEKYNIKPHLITKYADTLQEMNLLSIKSTDRRLHILARICGYLMTEGGIYKRHNKFNNYFMKAYFETEFSANMFEDDIEYLGFYNLDKSKRKIKYYERDLYGQVSNVYTVSHNNMVAILFMAFGVEPGRNKEVDHNQIPYWVMNGSPMVKREFLAGYQGGYGSSIKFNDLNNCVCAETCKRIHLKYKYKDSLKAFFNQMNTLYADLGIETTLLSNNLKYAIKMKDTKANLLKYFDTIGYRYNYSKITESAIVIEYMKINKPRDYRHEIKHQGLSMFIPIKSITEVENCLISDITTESENHSFIAADGFMIHNSAQCKQAIGVYALNYRDRYDTLGHVMHYPQRPIVKTKMASILNTDNMPNGTNAIVAIACYTG
jgi:DNA-directed RNA polymerase beta subunit